MKHRDIEMMAEEAAQMLLVLANGNRLMIMCHLLAGELCVADLCKRLGHAQPIVSQQLKKLRELNLVKTRRSGQQIFYSIASTQAVQLLEALHGIYCPDLDVTGEAPDQQPG